MSIDFNTYLTLVNKICENKIEIKESSLQLDNNYFLYKFNNSEVFKYHSLERIKRLYNTYKEDEYSREVILDNVRKLLYNNWDGAYSELVAYDCLNTIFQEPCEIQIDNSEIQTLAQFCQNKNHSAIDGFSKDIISYFEIKSLNPKYNKLVYKLKRELQSFDKENYFSFEVDATSAFEIKDYPKLKQEMLEAKKQKLNHLHSETNPNINFRLFYKPQGVTIDTNLAPSSYELAQKLELLPLEKYNQFVDGRFVKIFVCTNLNINSEIINNSEFFRALARRVFIRLTKLDDIFDDASDLKISDIAKTLSGILFIVDNTDSQKITNNSIPEDLYNLYVYSNPNTKFSSRFWGYRNITYANKILKATDDFESDNY